MVGLPAVLLHGAESASFYLRPASFDSLFNYSWTGPRGRGGGLLWQVSVDFCSYIPIVGPGSSVDIVTDYGLDGPVSNPGGDEIFRPSRPALGPTQPPLQWVPGKGGRGVGLTPHPHLVPKVLEKSRAITLFDLRAYVDYKQGRKPTIFLLSGLLIKFVA